MTFSRVDQPAAPQPVSPRGSPHKWTVGSSVFEAIAGGVSIVLAVLGLLGLIPTSLAALAAMSIGAALLANAKTMNEHFRQALQTSPVADGETNVRRGLRVEAVGGVVGLTLGFLALLGVASHVLLSANCIVIGLIMLFAGVVSAEVDATIFETEVETRKRRSEGLFVWSDTGRILAAIGSIVLGVVALNTIAQSVTYVLIAELAIGVVMLVSGSAIAGWTEKFAS